MDSLKSNDHQEHRSKCIQIRSKTWTRDSHGLFDYENNQVKTNSILIDKNGSLIRIKNELCFVPDTEILNDEENQELLELAKVTFINDKYQLTSFLDTYMPVNNETLTDLQEKIWYVVKSNNSNISVVNTNNSYLSQFKYQIRKNDIIKLGRIKFLIKEMNIAGGFHVTTDLTFRPYQECEKIYSGEGDICRICYNDSNDDNNPIISVCKCKGSVNLIHLNCLKMWLKEKLTTRETTNKPGISYTIKSFNCELCKEPYPTTLKYNDSIFHLLNYFIPEGQNFIILESLNSIKENQYPLSLHVLMFIENGDTFVLGRGHESDVRISDISVSRSHAKFTFIDKSFFLEDTGSKFGTLVLAKESVLVLESQTILQVGRTLLSATEIDKDAMICRKSSKELNKPIENKSDFMNLNYVDEDNIQTNFEKFILNPGDYNPDDPNKEYEKFDSDK